MPWKPIDPITKRDLSEYRRERKKTRFLVDEDVDPAVVKVLAESGYKAKHVSEVGWGMRAPPSRSTCTVTYYLICNSARPNEWRRFCLFPCPSNDDRLSGGATRSRPDCARGTTGRLTRTSRPQSVHVLLK